MQAVQHVPVMSVQQVRSGRRAILEAVSAIQLSKIADRLTKKNK